MFGIARISELSCWNSRGDLNTATLHQTADRIRSRYLSRTGQNVASSVTHPTLLGDLYGLLPFAAGRADYLGSGMPLAQSSPQSSPLPTTTITEAYRLSALIYLQILVSGVGLSSQEMTAAVGEAVGFLHYRVPPTEMDRFLVFPLFVTACASTGDQRMVIGRRLCGVHSTGTIGNDRNVFLMAQEVWRHLDNHIPFDWCQMIEQKYGRLLLM